MFKLMGKKIITILRNFFVYLDLMQTLTLNNFSPFIGTTAGESVADISVNSSAKLLTSNSWRIFGTNGAGIFFPARSFQLTP